MALNSEMCSFEALLLPAIKAFSSYIAKKQQEQRERSPKTPGDQIKSYKVVWDGLRIREGVSTDSPIVRVLKVGAILELQEQVTTDEGIVRARLADGSGWTSISFAKDSSTYLEPYPGVDAFGEPRDGQQGTEWLQTLVKEVLLLRLSIVQYLVSFKAQVAAEISDWLNCPLLGMAIVAATVTVTPTPTPPASESQSPAVASTVMLESASSGPHPSAGHSTGASSPSRWPSNSPSGLSSGPPRKVGLSPRGHHQSAAPSALIQLTQLLPDEAPRGDAATVIHIAKQHVAVDRGTFICPTTYAVCAALLWQHELADEVADLVSGAHQRPSTMLKDTWTLCFLEMQKYLKDGDESKSATEMQAIRQGIIDRARLLLEFVPVGGMGRAHLGSWRVSASALTPRSADPSPRDK